MSRYGEFYDTNDWLREISGDLDRIAAALETLVERQDASAEREREGR